MIMETLDKYAQVFTPCWVVIREHDAEVRQLIETHAPPRVMVLRSRHSHLGMGATLAEGMRQIIARGAPGGVFIGLADMPCVMPGSLMALRAALERCLDGDTHRTGTHTERRGHTPGDGDTHCIAERRGHTPSDGDTHCIAERRGHTPSDGDTHCIAERRGHTPGDGDTHCIAERRGHTPGDGDTHCIVRPLFNGLPGHPVGFGAAFFERLARASGDAGARHLLALHPQCVLDVPVEDPGIHIDFDTNPDVGA